MQSGATELHWYLKPYCQWAKKVQSSSCPWAQNVSHWEKVVTSDGCSQGFGPLEETCPEQQALEVLPGERWDWMWVHDSPSREKVTVVMGDEERDLDGEEWVRGGSVSTGQGRETVNDVVFLRAKENSV